MKLEKFSVELVLPEADLVEAGCSCSCLSCQAEAVQVLCLELLLEDAASSSPCSSERSCDPEGDLSCGLLVQDGH